MRKPPHLVDISQPFADAVERLAVSHVVDEHDAHCATVVGRCDGIKALLASSIPTFICRML